MNEVQCTQINDHSCLINGTTTATVKEDLHLNVVSENSSQ